MPEIKKKEKKVADRTPNRSTTKDTISTSEGQQLKERPLNLYMKYILLLYSIRKPENHRHRVCNGLCMM